MLWITRNNIVKDLFSTNSELYQQARPSYPQILIETILSQVKQTDCAWDCGAGSGQFTKLLSPYFSNVYATDLSQNQLEQAPVFENVEYSVQKAEQTNFKDNSFDLITVAQAIHWFNFDLFYEEVRRTLKKDGLIAVVGYGLLTIEDLEVNEAVQTLYKQTLNGFWDAERRYIEEEYKTIPFPFNELDVPELEMSYFWTGEQLIDYLKTWSALKNYAKSHVNDPLNEVVKVLKNRTTTLHIKFPILLRMGKVS
jgi:ubiquinone/menaquinone biosynthesis C-methylase UbiE